MYSFFVRVFADGDSPAHTAPLPVSFEEASESLSQLPSLFIEPDGSFVWRSSREERPSWQVEGNLYDRGDTLFYVELKGSCPKNRFDVLLSCLRTPTTELAFEWVEQGWLMNEAKFRKAAELPSPHSELGD